MSQEYLSVNNVSGQRVLNRRQRKKRRRLARLCILLVVLLFVCVKLCGSLFHYIDGKAGLSGVFSDGDLESTMVLSGEYPDSLIDLMERNPETKQFVMDYPKKKDITDKINLSGEIIKGEIPLFLQWDERWGYRLYGNDFMALNGCGPTCLSMVRCGLSGDGKWNPYKMAKMAESEGYYVKGEGTSWSLMTNGAIRVGLTVREVTFSEEGIRTVLNEGCPIICVVGPGDFTTTGHFLVLTGVSGNGEIRVQDPNSKKNSEKTWRVDTLMSQIRNLWAYSF